MLDVFPLGLCRTMTSGGFDHFDPQLSLEVDLNPGPPSPRQRTKSGHVSRGDGDAAVADLFNSALRLKGKPFLTGLLKFVSKTRQYSVFNLSLVFRQRPGATAVGTESYWLRHNRTIKEDALPLVILQPKGPVCFVYELADTEGGSDLFGDQYLDPFVVQGAITEEDWYGFLAGISREKFFTVSERNNGWGLAGSIRALRATPQSRVSIADKKFRIQIASRLSSTQKAVTLAHELAHAFCGHLGELPKCWWQARQNLCHSAEEFEAEVTSWIVARRAGLEPRSAEYLVNHVDKTVLNEISIDAIVRAANRIESMGFPVARK